MRIFAVLLIGALALAGAASAENYVVRDRDGRMIGTIEQTPGNTLYRHDWPQTPVLGQDVRRSERLPLRDSYGRRIGSIEPWIGDKLIVRDEHGRQLDVIGPIGNGRYIMRDSMGRPFGSVDGR